MRRKQHHSFILLKNRIPAVPLVSGFCRESLRCGCETSGSPHEATQWPTARFSSSAVIVADRGSKDGTRGHTWRDTGVSVLARCLAARNERGPGQRPEQAGGRRIAGRSACLPWERETWRFSNGFRVRAGPFSASGGVLNIQNFSFFLHIPFAC